MDATQLITVGGLLLTVVGLVLSIVALMAARQQTTDLKLISNSLSTRYLGQFPDYFPDVIDVIKSANKELKVVCTIPIHGVYSKRDGWLGTKHELENAENRGVSVFCVFADRTNREDFLKRQFPNAVAQWSTFRTNNLQKIEIFLKSHGSGTIDALSSNGFFDLFDKAAATELNTTYKSATVKEVAYRPSVYMWIADEKSAVFAISSTAPAFFAEAFRTTDTKLIQSLVRLHREYSDDGEQNPEGVTGTTPRDTTLSR